MDCPGPLRIRIGGIKKDQKRLSKLFQFCDDPIFCLQIILSRNIAYRTVGGDYNTDRRMLGNYLSGAQLRCLAHGDIMVDPGSCYHSRLVVLRLSGGSRDQITNTVDQANRKGGAIIHINSNSLFRHKFGFRCHNGSSGTALGQFIPGPFPPIDIFDVWDHQRFHETLDKSGLSRADRADHTNVYVTIGTLGNIIINLIFFHRPLPLIVSSE